MGINSSTTSPSSESAEPNARPRCKPHTVSGSTSAVVSNGHAANTMSAFFPRRFKVGSNPRRAITSTRPSTGSAKMRPPSSSCCAARRPTSMAESPLRMISVRSGPGQRLAPSTRSRGQPRRAWLGADGWRCGEARGASSVRRHPPVDQHRRCSETTHVESDRRAPALGVANPSSHVRPAHNSIPVLH